MVAKARTIEIEPGSETAKLLDEADRAPLTLVLGERRYHLEHLDSGDEAYDPEEARRILEEVAGTWPNEYADELIETLYRARIEGSRPMTRPKPL